MVDRDSRDAEDGFARIGRTHGRTSGPPRPHGRRRPRIPATDRSDQAQLEARLRAACTADDPAGADLHARRVADDLARHRGRDQRIADQRRRSARHADEFAERLRVALAAREPQ